MESSLDNLKYPPPSYLRRGRPDTQVYNQESDCPHHYRRHHSWGEQKQKNLRSVPRHICRRSSHSDILRPPHQQPHHYRYHYSPNQQNQQNNSNGTLTTNITTTTTTTTTTNNNNNNNNRESENISCHGVKCLRQTHQQSLIANRRSEVSSATPRRTLIRISRSSLGRWIPLQCRGEFYPENRGGFIYRESPLNLTRPSLTLSRLSRQHSDPGAYYRPHDISSCSIYLGLVPRRQPEEKPNLCTHQQSKLKNNNLTLGACPLEGQSQSICDCPRGGWDAHQGCHFPGLMNLEERQGQESEATRISNEDKAVLDTDFVMGGRDTSVLPRRIIHDRIVPRQGHIDIRYPVFENGDRKIRRAVDSAAFAHELVNPKASGESQNHKESNACRTQHENSNSCTMSGLTRKEFSDEFETNSEQSVLNDNSKSIGKISVQRTKSMCNDSETQRKEGSEKNTNTNIHDNHKLKITTVSNFGENSTLGTKNKTIYKTESNLYANNILLSLGRFITGYNFRVFFFVFFVGCALQCTSPGAGRCRTSWFFPGADAKAVVSLSKNVLMTDADHKQVSSLGKIDPPSESTKGDQSFNDFPDVDSDGTDVSDSNGNDPGSKGYVGDESSPSTNRNSKDSDNKENLDEYEAYDDSAGEDSKVRTDSDSKIENPGKESSDQNTDKHNRYSDETDEKIADSFDEEDNDYDEDEDEDDEDEDWAGDMSSQPLFVPPGMNVDGGQAGVGATGKHSTEQETTAKSEEPQREIPEYMLKLYQKFTQKHYIHPASDTVRSFSNINDDILFNISSGNELPGAKTRNHTLIFNISSFPRGEQINLAQLRLYKLVERDRNTYVGDDRKVSLYEVIPEDGGSRHLKLVSQKHIYGRNSGWESFDVTPAVRRWVAEIENGVVQMLEVTIESIFNSVWGNDVDISTEPRNKKEPLLIVFSKQINKRLVHQQERDELLQHDMTLSDIEDVDNFTTTEPPLSSPSSDGDQSDDEEDEDDDDDEDSSSEDSNGSIGEMTSYAKVTQSMRTGKEYLSRPKQKVRVKRSKTSSKRNICRRTKLEVDFSDIQGHDWIVAPKKYQAFECSGKCYFPLGDHLRPTKHAIIRANLHVHNKKVTRPCCVPTKLDSISLLYLDSKTNGYTFKYKFEGMKVVECGCR